jgi:hypothetical protein
MREGCDDTFDLVRSAQVDWAYLDADRWRHRLDDSELADSLSSASLSENSRARHAWRNLLEHLEPFRADAVFIRGKTGDVAARPRQTVDEARANRIGHDREHNRHGACRTVQWPDRRTA